MMTLHNSWYSPLIEYWSTSITEYIHGIKGNATLKVFAGFKCKDF